MIQKPNPSPVHERVREKFGPYVDAAWFAYGDTIFCPNGEPPPPDVLAHEEVHAEQQRTLNGPESSPELWWDHYLADPAFRLTQEVEGYAAQLRHLLRKDRQKKRQWILRVVDSLVGPLYGRMTDRRTATRLVLEAAGEK